MEELSLEGRRVVEALVEAPVAWQTPSDLARAMGRDLDETTDLVALLDASGWLAAWERDRDVVVTLSVAGASALGLRLIESGREEVPRWARRGDPEPPGLRASGVFRNERAAALELVVDPSSTAEEAFERAESERLRGAIPADPRVKPAVESLPGPTLLVGLGLVPWPGPGDGRKASCPSCGSKWLKPSMYCLYCDRWGLDHLLIDEPVRSRQLADPNEDVRRRESERQTRKARRKARLLAQAETERSLKRRRRRA